VPFRDGVKTDIVTDRVEIITITRLSSLTSCALHEKGASKDEPRTVGAASGTIAHITIAACLRLARTG
jgi:hypothetical protein